MCESEYKYQEQAAAIEKYRERQESLSFLHFYRKIGLTWNVDN